jgi:hypothetical protein
MSVIIDGDDRFWALSGHDALGIRCPLSRGYCCKSLFAVVTKNSPGCRRDFRVKM